MAPNWSLSHVHEWESEIFSHSWSSTITSPAPSATAVALQRQKPHGTEVTVVGSRVAVPVTEI